MWPKRIVVVLLSMGGVVLGTTPVATHATSTVDVVGPAGSENFGKAQVLVLTNGNYVVTDPYYDGTAIDEGAAYLYNGLTNQVISTLTGSGPSDRVGEGGVVEVGDSNFVVSTPGWTAGVVPGNKGAVTWGSGTAGVSGIVSSANSLVGSSLGDLVGSYPVTVLTNGNYTVDSFNWHDGANGVGAVTWGNGTTGISGPVTTTNSLVGTANADNVGDRGVTPLTNGNYVVRSTGWNGGVGAATWGNGTTGTTGPVSPTNSLVGSTAGDQVGQSGITALTNGNYVVASSNFDATRLGAATWGNGATGTTGVVSAANSLVGSQPNDNVGSGVMTALANGNYVVSSPVWDDGTTTADVGAATWGDGATGIIGPVTTANSLVGTQATDEVGIGGVTALTNGNYVVASYRWDDVATADAGAATWGNGATGLVGTVSAANSLVGSTASDQIGSAGVWPLTNGNYVVTSRSWHNGAVAQAGAATWGNGTTGITGTVTPANSLVGTSVDEVGSGGVTALTNGNYVVHNFNWDNGLAPNAGAATWGNGTTGITGPVTAANSLVGTSTDQVGLGTTALANGNYVVASPNWDNGSIANAGAMTFGPAGGITGTINASNSALGTAPGDVINASKRLTADNAIAVSTNSNRVILLRVPDLDYVALAPARLAETRAGLQTVDGQFAAGGTRPTGSTLALTVAGRGGVAADAIAVSLNVTVANPAGSGFVTVYPCGSTHPTASNLNYTTGAVVPNAVIAKIGNNGQVCVFVSMATDLIVDVNGYFPTTTSLTPINPARVLETRPGLTTSDNLQQGIGARTAGSVTAVQIGGRATVPADASAVVLNVTVTAAQGPGFVTVYPCGTTIPTASNINYITGSTVANLVVAKIGSGSQVCVYTSNAIDLIADVNGYFPARTTYRPLNPARLLETRAGLTTIDTKFQGGGLRSQNSVLALDVTGRGGVPTGATTAVLNITVTESTAGGFITVYPCGIDPPLASNLNYDVNTTVANAVIVKIGTNGQVCLLNSGPTQLVVDVAGYIN